MIKLISSTVLVSLSSAYYLNATDANCTASINSHSIASLPSFNETGTLPCMYSGFIKSSNTLNHNLFYWMYKTEDSDNQPITVWLNGGPGSSSIFGNFLENGPLIITSDNTTGSVVYDVNNNP